MSTIIECDQPVVRNFRDRIVLGRCAGGLIAGRILNRIHLELARSLSVELDHTLSVRMKVQKVMNVSGNENHVDQLAVSYRFTAVAVPKLHQDGLSSCANVTHANRPQRNQWQTLCHFVIHGYYLRSVLLSIRFSYPVPWKILCTYTLGVCT